MVNLFPPCRVPTYRVYGDVPVLMLVRKSFPRRALPRRVNDTSLIGCGDWIMKAKVRRMAVVSTTLRVETCVRSSALEIPRTGSSGI